MIRRAIVTGGPIRDNDRLLMAVAVQDDVIGVLALLDPDETAGEREEQTLRRGAIALAVELARFRGLVAVERHLGANLVEDLVTGADEARSVARAQALGYDIEGPHRVGVLKAPHTGDGDELMEAVGRAGRQLGLDALWTQRSSSVVVVAKTDAPWERLHAELQARLGTDRVRMGVGGSCDRPSTLPRSLREAQLVLRLQDMATAGAPIVFFDDLGVYRILGQVDDIGSIEGFARQWLGPLLVYDDAKHGDLVATLDRYLELGGHYAATAEALSIHRNTLKYRLRRITSVSGHDLADPETRFNLQLATRAWRTLAALQSST